MNTEQMTREQAIKELENCSCSPVMRKAIDVALAALRAQQNPEPLTLAEMKARGRKPVYIMRVEANKVCRNSMREGWYLNYPERKYVRDDIDIIHYEDIFNGIRDTAGGRVKFGFNAYDRQPGEGRV